METNWICWIINNFSNWLYDRWMAVPLESAWKFCSTSCQIWNGTDCLLSQHHFKTVEQKWNSLSKINPPIQKVVHLDMNSPMWRRMTVNNEMMLKDKPEDAICLLLWVEGPSESEWMTQEQQPDYFHFSWKRLLILININIKTKVINI